MKAITWGTHCDLMRNNICSTFTNKITSCCLQYLLIYASQIQVEIFFATAAYDEPDVKIITNISMLFLGYARDKLVLELQLTFFSSWLNLFSCSSPFQNVKVKEAYIVTDTVRSQLLILTFHTAEVKLPWYRLKYVATALGFWQSYWVHQYQDNDAIGGIHIHCLIDSVVPFYISTRCYWSNNKWQSNRKQQFTGMLRIPKCAWYTACAAPSTPLINRFCKIPSLM